MALINKLQAIGNAIRSKTGKTEQLSLDNMVTEIEGIQTGSSEITDEELTFSGDCKYLFTYDNWNWFINKFKNRIKIVQVSDGIYLFANSSQIEDLSFWVIDNTPFDTKLVTRFSHAFDNCNKLKKLPKFKNTAINQLDWLFSDCSMLREIPDDTFDNISLEYFKANGNSVMGLFRGCCSLRKIPYNILNNLNWTQSNYANMFQRCLVLDEIIVPVSTAIMNYNKFKSFVQECSKLKKLIFEIEADGTPKIAQWKSQTIDLSYAVGYLYSNTDDYVNEVTTQYNSGITKDKRVNSKEDYERLKNDPDWFTGLVAYSRYNHDSAVETINSLPDTSEYLAIAGGTNTIKFEGNAGSKTDGGAINTLTEEEIAVATAKGWTVTLV